MSYAVIATDVNDAFSRCINLLLDEGIRENSRNGKVIVLPDPITITYLDPKKRVLFSPLRDANPFFHLMESLWMLAGRNDVEWPQYFNSRFKEYSDDGQFVHGAYGYRWRCAFGFDQLQVIIDELKRNPTSRRCVLQMWDTVDSGMDDLHLAMSGGKDVPCNTHIYFDCRNGQLNMTVCNRSNDAIWGALGANVVHFSILQEYMAYCIGVRVGVYRQFSNNFHAYTDVFTEEKLRVMASDAYSYNLYPTWNLKPYPLMSTPKELWDKDLQIFMTAPGTGKFNDTFFTHVAQPMYKAWLDRKEGLGTGRESLGALSAQDWAYACSKWIERRESKHV